jgi:hypothetical protein
MVKKDSNRKKTPLGVKIVFAVLLVWIIFNFVNLCVSIYNAFSNGSGAGVLVQALPDLIISIFYFVLAIMLLRLKEWARVLVIFMSFNFFLSTITSAASLGIGSFLNLFSDLFNLHNLIILIFGYIAMVVSLINGFYLLLNKKVRGAFK